MPNDAKRMTIMIFFIDKNFGGDNNKFCIIASQKIKMKKFNLIIYLIFINLLNFAQRYYFDRYGNEVKDPNSAYFNCELDNSGKSKCYYTSNQSVYFEGTIKSIKSSFEKSIFDGQCVWFYKNGKKMMEKFFNSKGELIKHITYKETGELDKIYEYVNGQLKDNAYFENDEANRLWKIYEENFSKNTFDWEIYSSDLGTSQIKNNSLEICSNNDYGMSRWVTIPFKDNDDFVIDVSTKSEFLPNYKAKKKDLLPEYCLIFGFKDWNNYNYFCVSPSKQSLEVGYEYEGILQNLGSSMYSSSIQQKEKNNLKVVFKNNKYYYSINGEIVYTSSNIPKTGNGIGFLVKRKGCVQIDQFKVKHIAEENYTSHFPDNTTNFTINDDKFIGSGTGFLLNKDGYLMTCYHVIDKAKDIYVEFPELSKQLKARTIVKDPKNDIAILKIDDLNIDSVFIKFSNEPIQTGDNIFTLGYPYAISGMGKEIKFADGKISSKTGFNGDINSYQSTIPVQPGNSGSPVFNEKGEVIGMINAKFKESDNVSYIVKTPLLQNVMTLSNDNIKLSEKNTIANNSLQNKIKKLSKNIAIVKIK